MARSYFITAVLSASFLIIFFWQSTLIFNRFHNLSSQAIKSDYGTHRQKNVSKSGEYLLGVGKADITGPVVEINMMGYADMDQVGSGLRQRLYCRAFIIGSISESTDRIVYLVLDTQSGDTAIRHGILQGLQDLGHDFAGYTKDNVAVTGTHSHAGPGAWLNYLLPQITSKGFDMSSYQAIVDGSLLAIKRAHENLAPGYLSIGAMDLQSININRSPYAYQANPKDERSKYSSDVDKSMTLLRFDRVSDEKAIGVLSWFAVHGTSLYGNNTLISGDNKGVAAYLFERDMVSDHPGFVAGFSQSNVGDTSPNILGAYCEDSGLPCRLNDSSCGGNIRTCHGRGPFYTVPDQGTKSCFEIGRLQYSGAKSLFHSTSLQRLSGLPTVSSFHTYADLSSYTFPSPFNSSLNRTTCSAALGHSFAGGTSDGPGAFDFKQGTDDHSPDSPSQRNPLWKLARAFVHEPTPSQIACQHPKPILLDVGAATSPYAWTPNIVDIQLLRVGPLLIIISPGEATTMSGRRWREALTSAATASSTLHIPSPWTVLGGPANSYTHYIATEEEYSIQRYEGASTLYGPHTLEAYINLTLTYLPYLAETTSRRARLKLPILPAGPSPPINTNASLSFINPVVFDRAPLFHSFGDVIASPQLRVYRPGEVVKTRFVGANPRNSLRLEGTYAVVEMLDVSAAAAGKSGGEGGRKGTEEMWTTVRTDADWNLVFRWERTSTVWATSAVSVEWEIEDADADADGDGDKWVVQPGMYRMRYFGDAKTLGGGVVAFEGVGDPFRVGGPGMEADAETEAEGENKIEQDLEYGGIG